MWSKVTLRMKITILTMLALTLFVASLTALSIFNAQRLFVIPIEALGIELYDVQVIPRYELEILPETYAPDGTVVIHHNVISPHNRFQTSSIAIAFAFVLVGTALAYFISWQALKPIKSLSNEIEFINSNNLTTRLEPPKCTTDEVSHLTVSFNNMLGKLCHVFDSQKLFAQNAAHELITPLTSIKSNISVLKIDDEPSIDEYRQVIDVVENDTERLINIVEGLLRLNSVIDESKWQPFEGREVLDQIISELNEDILRKGIDVEITGNCRIKGDKTLCERALHNLVHNAVRYNVNDGKIKIELTEKSISIEDSGVGIADENLEQIFQPFYCVDKSRSKKLGGNGLGLSIAKNILNRHHIEIVITSELGQGTKILLKKSSW